MYGLIGSVLAHSYSKEIHHYFGLDNYFLFELDENEFIEKIRKKDYNGLNITVPYKKKVIPLLDVLDEDAESIGSVNTVVNRNGILFGYNTDYYGFEYLLQTHKISVDGKKVLVLGNGGAAQPVLYYLKTHNASEIIIVKRKTESGVITYEDALTLHSNADLIINTSPVGMFPNVDESLMFLDGYYKLSAVVDLVANPKETKLMRLAKSKNIPAVGGLEMLVAQAKKAEELFCDIKIPKEEIDNVTEKISNIMDERKVNRKYESNGALR